MGELLKQYDGRGSYNGNQHTGNIGKRDLKDPSSNSVNSVASSIGLSSKQTKEAVRFANVPIDKFEAIIESDNIPTKSEIAELGTKLKQTNRFKPKRNCHLYIYVIINKRINNEQ